MHRTGTSTPCMIQWLFMCPEISRFRDCDCFDRCCVMWGEVPWDREGSPLCWSSEIARSFYLYLYPHDLVMAKRTRVYPPFGGCGSPTSYPHVVCLYPHGPCIARGKVVYSLLRISCSPYHTPICLSPHGSSTAGQTQVHVPLMGLCLSPTIPPHDIPIPTLPFHG